jgi:hypothetical protein
VFRAASAAESALWASSNTLSDSGAIYEGYGGMKDDESSPLLLLHLQVHNFYRLYLSGHSFYFLKSSA